MKTYVPQPGTIPARAVAFFQLQPAGAEFSTAMLADALDTDRVLLGPALKTPVSHGALAVEKRDGINYYTLGDGTPPASDTDPDPNLKVTQRIVPAAAATAATAIGAWDRFASGRPDRRASPPAVFRAALWSDGQLAIEKGADSILLSLDETRRLVAYLERMAEGEPA